MKFQLDEVLQILHECSYNIPTAKFYVLKLVDALGSTGNI